MRRCGITQSKFLELTTGSCVRQVLQFQIDGTGSRLAPTRPVYTPCSACLTV